jgi:hypothetical protein
VRIVLQEKYFYLTEWSAQSAATLQTLADSAAKVAKQQPSSSTTPPSRVASRTNTLCRTALHVLKRQHSFNPTYSGFDVIVLKATDQPITSHTPTSTA